MSKLSKALPIVAITAAVIQSPFAVAAIDSSNAVSPNGLPIVMAFQQDDAAFNESTRLNQFSVQLIKDIETSMMPVGCDGDYDCYKKICGTGTFSGRKAGVDDSDAAC